MNYKVYVSDRAKKQIAEHIAFVANINKSSAKILKKRMIKTLQSLSDMPRRCPHFHIDSSDNYAYRKMPLEGKYIAVYHIEDTAVYIDYVIDCRQDYGWLLK